MHSGPRFHVERQDGAQLRLGEDAHVGDGELGVCPGLRRERSQCRLALGGGDLEAVKLARVELPGKRAHRRVALVANPAQNIGHRRLDGERIRGGVAPGRLDVGDLDSSLLHAASHGLMTGTPQLAKSLSRAAIVAPFTWAMAAIIPSAASIPFPAFRVAAAMAA